LFSLVYPLTLLRKRISIVDRVVICEYPNRSLELPWKHSVDGPYSTFLVNSYVDVTADFNNIGNLHTM
jgi:hypothetical protein